MMMKKKKIQKKNKREENGLRMRRRGAKRYKEDCRKRIYKAII